jgi:phospholipid transport system substrate-binding protein
MRAISFGLFGTVRGPVPLALGLALALVALIGPVRAAPEAGQFLSNLSSRAIAQMTEPGLSDAEKKQRFGALVDEGFDIPAIGKFVLGRYWRNTSPAEKDEFLATFKDMMVSRFLPVFDDYSGERLKVGVVRPFAEGTNIISVSSELARPNGEPVKVDWRLLLQPDGGYKIVDIIAEGVSIAVTLRSEYTAALKNNNGNVADLTRILREKIAGG